jgi:EAL domain-containing protein (putative c-di-GMP-specific phosphodiesterase class I)
LGFETVAEGVETEEQAALIIQLGTTNHQGFLYAKPVAADEISKLFKPQ